MSDEFIDAIKRILRKNFDEDGDELLHSSELISYISIKTKSASKGSKSRGSFANLYAIYVLLEDYILNGYQNRNDYSSYSGARFSDLFNRQRQLPFGAKLQNHGLNSRLNEEFKKYFPHIESPVIIRDPDSQRYWINESLVRIQLKNLDINLATTIIEIIEAYVAVKQRAFRDFIDRCNYIADNTDSHAKEEVYQFVNELLDPNVDARLFEIVSFAILKAKYQKTTVWHGKNKDSVKEFEVELFKTGRTNANDGGIDFVMRPVGRFFQVTESMDLNKYFLDIDKVQHFPITFVIKTEQSVENIMLLIRTEAQSRYTEGSIVEKYMSAVEEIINLPILRAYLNQVIESDGFSELISEIARQSKVEFNE